MKENEYMQAAIEEAKQAAFRGEVPVGAVVVKKGEIIAKAGNETIANHDPTAHAEIVAIRRACINLGNQRLTDCDLYVTLEPCTQCAAAISFARIRRLYFGAEDAKGGAVINGVHFYEQPSCFHVPEYYSGHQEIACAKLLVDFFNKRRSAETTTS